MLRAALLLGRGPLAGSDLTTAGSSSPAAGGGAFKTPSRQAEWMRGLPAAKAPGKLRQTPGGGSVLGQPRPAAPLSAPCSAGFHDMTKLTLSAKSD